MITYKEVFSVSKLEAYLYSLIYKNVSDHVFAGTLGDTIKESWNDMVLIDCVRLDDKDALANGVVNIFLYARPKGDGSKNVTLMSTLERKLNTVLKNAEQDEHFIINRNSFYQDYDSNRKWHFNVIVLNVTII